jgi:beta-fructofuranosidase
VALVLPDRWVWDFWLARDGDTHHLFYLQAPTSLADPDRRHWNVSIGHATSTDLRRWTVLPDALGPADGPAWDDYTTWTGCVLQHEGTWWMFYTGTSRSEDGLVQRIGAATSPDLTTWDRVGRDPLLEADARWYEQLDRAVWHDQAWRDPWVVRDGDRFHLFCTARVPHGEPRTRGVIGHAVSHDLLHWEVQPPVTEPGVFGEMEIPQVVQLRDRWVLLFSAPAASAEVEQSLPGVGITGTHLLRAHGIAGPYSWDTHELVDGDARASRYGGKAVSSTGGWQLLTWLMHDEHGQFVGAISDPRPVELG